MKTDQNPPEPLRSSMRKFFSKLAKNYRTRLAYFAANGGATKEEIENLQNSLIWAEDIARNLKEKEKC